MAAGNKDLYIEQGATFRLTVHYTRKTGDQDVDGNDIVVPYDLTGAAIRMQIRNRRGGTVLVSATTSNGGIVVTDPPNGKFVLTITDEATDQLSVKKGKYDLEVSYPSGDVVRILQGNVTFDPNITQDATTASVTRTPIVSDIDEQDVDMDAEVTDQPSTAF